MFDTSENSSKYFTMYLGNEEVMILLTHICPM